MIHKHVSQEVLDANRKNCRHPHRTKTRGNHNALTHGLLARALEFKSEKEAHRFRSYRTFVRISHLRMHSR
jgi:hypothetical protein